MKLAAAMPKLFSIKFKFPFAINSRCSLKREKCPKGNLVRASSVACGSEGNPKVK